MAFLTFMSRKNFMLNGVEYMNKVFFRKYVLVVCGHQTCKLIFVPVQRVQSV